MCQDIASLSSSEIFPRSYQLPQSEWMASAHGTIKTLFIQYMTPEIYGYGSISIAHTSLFVQQKGYHLHLYTKDDLKLIPPLLSRSTKEKAEKKQKGEESEDSDERWNKILLLHHSIHRLLSLPNHEQQQEQYVVWMDSDIIINDWSFMIEQYTQSFPYAQLIISKEFLNEHGLINSGFIITKVSSYSLQLLQQWYTLHDRNSISDQHAFSALYDENTLNIQEHSVILTANALNNRFPVWHYLQPDDKLIHLAGVQDVVRVNVFVEAMKSTCNTLMSVSTSSDEKEKRRMLSESGQILDKASLQSLLRYTQQQLAGQAVDAVASATSTGISGDDDDRDDSQVIRRARDLIQSAIQLGYARPREYKDDSDSEVGSSNGDDNEERDVCVVSSVLLRALETQNQLITDDDSLTLIAQLQTRVDLSFEYLENSGYFHPTAMHAASLRAHCATLETHGDSDMVASSLLFDNTAVANVSLQVLTQVRRSLLTMSDSLHLLLQNTVQDSVEIDIEGESSVRRGSNEMREAKEKVVRPLLFYVFKYYSAGRALLERSHPPASCTSSNNDDFPGNHVTAVDREHLHAMKISSLEYALQHLSALDRIDGGDGSLLHCSEDIREESSSTLAVLASLLCEDTEATSTIIENDNSSSNEKEERCWLAVYDPEQLWPLLDSDGGLAEALGRWKVNTTLPAVMTAEIDMQDLSMAGTVCEYGNDNDGSNGSDGSNSNRNRNRCKDVIRGSKLATHGALLLKSVWSQRVAPLHIMNMFDSLNAMAHQCRIDINGD